MFAYINIKINICEMVKKFILNFVNINKKIKLNLKKSKKKILDKKKINIIGYIAGIHE